MFAIAEYEWKKAETWLSDNFAKLEREARRRETTVTELIVHMLTDVLAVYEDMTDAELQEERLATAYETEQNSISSMPA